MSRTNFTSTYTLIGSSEVSKNNFSIWVYTQKKKVQFQWWKWIKSILLIGRTWKALLFGYSFDPSIKSCHLSFLALPRSWKTWMASNLLRELKPQFQKKPVLPTWQLWCQDFMAWLFLSHNSFQLEFGQVHKGYISWRGSILQTWLILLDFELCSMLVVFA